MPPSGEAPKPMTDTSIPVFPRGRFGIFIALACATMMLGLFGSLRGFLDAMYFILEGFSKE